MSVPEFGEWSKRKGVFTRDYSGHFAMIRSVRRCRKKLLSWTSIRNGDELADQSSKPVLKHPEQCRHFSEYDNSRRFSNSMRKSPVIYYFEFILRSYKHVITKLYKCVITWKIELLKSGKIDGDNFRMTMTKSTFTK